MTAPATITPERLLADALDIADDSSESAIVCNLTGNDEWYDLDSADSADKEFIAQAVRYLLARGLIEQEGSRVRFKA